jgi:hypothetical protein
VLFDQTKEDLMYMVCSTYERDENAYEILVDDFEGEDCWKELGADGQSLLRWILSTYGAMLWTGITCHRIQSSSEHGNKS